MRQDHDYEERLLHENRWSGMLPHEYERETRRTALNEHQFGEQGTLFDAPLGQPSSGTFRGNQHARLYRSVGVHSGAVDAGDHQQILDDLNRPRKDAGHNINMGIHWQHDLDVAKDYGNSYLSNGRGRHGEHNLPVIIEADHPGNEHIIDNSTDWKHHDWGGGRTYTEAKAPKELGPNPDARMLRRNELTGYAKDWSLINDTVGPHNEDSWMHAEVPVRPGAPVRVHAIHTPDPNRPGEYIRNPVQFKGIA